MKTALLSSGLVLGAAVLAGCAMNPASPVRVDVAETGLPNCQTFQWLPTPQQPASFTEQRVKSEVMAKLKDKGYTEVPDKADCRVTYVLEVHEQPRGGRPNVGVGAGGGSGGIGGGIGVSLPIGRRNQQAGTFTIDVVDAAKNAQVWSGSLDVTLAKPELNADEASEVVAKVLNKYPNRAAK